MPTGTFKCYKCDDGFDDYDDYTKHIAEIVHTHKGVAPCNICGISTEFNFTGKLAPKKLPALCKSCGEKLLEGEND